MRGHHGFLIVVEDDHAPSRRFPARGWETCMAIIASDALALLDRGPEPAFIVLPMRLPEEGGAAGLRNKRHTKSPGEKDRWGLEYIREKSRQAGCGGDRAGLVLTRIILQHRKHSQRKFHVRKEGE